MPIKLSIRILMYIVVKDCLAMRPPVHIVAIRDRKAIHGSITDYSTDAQSAALSRLLSP